MASGGPFACRYDDPHIEFERLLLAPGPDLFVMDEAHRIKNDGATLSKALARVATRKRVLLTGTPLQNNLVEYYHMVDFVSPGMLMGAPGRRVPSIASSWATK
jgi:N12 class adenine-specific DNA methylase